MINGITMNWVSTMSVALTVVFVAIYFRGGNVKKASSCTPEQRKKRAVLITGASRGIGKTIAVHLSSLGYTVFGSVRSQSSFDKLNACNSNNEEELSDTEGKIIPVIFDVTDDKEIEAAVITIDNACKENRLDFIAIINNAGINPEGDMLATLYSDTGKSPENILTDSRTVTNVLDTNVVGCFRVTRAFMPLLKKGDASIVLIGSYFGSIAGAINLSHLAYESSKFALEGLADGMRRSLKKEGIRVSLIKPGNIQTDMNELAGEVPPVVVAYDVLAAIEDKKSHARYYPGLVKGLSCRMLCTFFSIFPSWLTDKQL
ncbi:MAG: NAD(P)-dependent dehydrogenase (short-subunit alcohol dehydrogenase family) [Bacillariaceae sp.]|jgi:NAD(P)-dependent dehydrogenase (short-subunit alcohol dehydrogenase family)